MTKLETLTLESANFNVFLKNNRLSQRQRPHLGSPEAALTAVIKECERMCAASVCVCVQLVFSHIFTVYLVFLFFPKEHLYLHFNGAHLNVCAFKCRQ